MLAATKKRDMRDALVTLWKTLAIVMTTPDPFGLDNFVAIYALLINFTPLLICRIGHWIWTSRCICTASAASLFLGGIT